MGNLQAERCDAFIHVNVFSSMYIYYCITFSVLEGHLGEVVPKYFDPWPCDPWKKRQSLLVTPHHRSQHVDISCKQELLYSPGLFNVLLKVSNISQQRGKRGQKYKNITIVSLLSYSFDHVVTPQTSFGIHLEAHNPQVWNHFPYWVLYHIFSTRSHSRGHFITLCPLERHPRGH